MIEKAKLKVDEAGHLSGERVIKSERKLGDIAGIFESEIEDNRFEEVAYRVEMHADEKEGVEGGLFFGTSYIFPGNVNGEYFMTKGHFHAKRQSAEYYWGISGNGILLLMDESGKCFAEEVSKGSVHYIKGHVAHRLVNIGEEVLAVGACWPSDAGHDYETIAEEGFSCRVKKGPQGPIIIENTSSK